MIDELDDFWNDYEDDNKPRLRDFIEFTINLDQDTHLPQLKITQPKFKKKLSTSTYIKPSKDGSNSLFDF